MEHFVCDVRQSSFPGDASSRGMKNVFLCGDFSFTFHVRKSSLVERASETTSRHRGGLTDDAFSIQNGDILRKVAPSYLSLRATLFLTTKEAGSFLAFMQLYVLLQSLLEATYGPN